jgi:anthranilate synthase component 1
MSKPVTNTSEFEQLEKLANDYNLLPIVREVLADTETPIRLFEQFKHEKYAFLLESVEGGAKWARYSFIGMSPFLTVRTKNGVTEVTHDNQTERLDGKPLQALKQLLAQYRSPQNSPHAPDLPRFTGGAVGFFGYDLLQYYERLPKHRIDDLQMNDLQFMFCDHVIVFDHLKQRIKIIANVHVPEDRSQFARAYEDTCKKIEKLYERLAEPIREPLVSVELNPSIADTLTLQSNMSKEQFLENVEAAKEYIRAGDIFQVVLSQRFEMSTSVSPLHVYRVLRTMNPSPYMYVLKMDEETIVGTSPELLVRVEGIKVDTRPIAGTRPRGKTTSEDIALEQDLLADEKELAEHRMLVDLGRNDLGRVCNYGTVHCDTFMEIERYSHVMHIVSNVTGELKTDHDFYDAFISCMPAGTVSGAPKLRAMEIIAELEPNSRGAYAGAIGYLGFSGNLDTCITIRTIIFKHGKAYIQAGAGIVADSIPENEYQETVNKAKASLLAIRTAEQMFQGGKRDE